MISPNRSAIRTVVLRAEDIIILIEPLWAISATTLVYLAYLLNASTVLPWIGIGLACLPVFWRMMRNRRSICPTPFDIPISLLLMGAFIGWYSSPNRTISLGALQCMLVASLLYYSMVSYKYRTSLLKWVIALSVIGFLVALLLFILNLPGVARQPTLVIGGSGTHHGLVMYLAVLGAVFFGIGVFGGNTKWRVLAVTLSLSLLIVVVIMTSKSLARLIDFSSIRGRLPLWEKTLDLMKDSPFSGLGLGGWAIAYWGTTVLGGDAVGGVTHPHNAYLSLYADTGALGLLALCIALIVGLKLSLDIVMSPSRRPWRGFGIGVILACITTLLVAVVESAPEGVPLVAAETYYYVISPIPWILCALLVVVHHEVTKDSCT